MPYFIRCEFFSLFEQRKRITHKILIQDVNANLNLKSLRLNEFDDHIHMINTVDQLLFGAAHLCIFLRMIQVHGSINEID